MAELKYTPVPHNHDQFLAKAREREGFAEAYDSLEIEYQVVNQLLKVVRASPRTLSLSAWAQQRAQSLALKQLASMHPLSQP